MAVKVRYLVRGQKVTEKYFAKIREAGVPKTKVDREYLKMWGFEGSNDYPLIPFLKFLGFLDSQGMPTDRYRRYRVKSTAPRVMADAVREAYSDLFATYPNAHEQDTEALTNYFKGRTEFSEKTIAVAVATFKALVKLSDFGDFAEEEEPPKKKAALLPKKRAAQDFREPEGFEIPALAITIKLQLPETLDGAVYDKLFSSLRKHLLSPPKEEK